MKIFQLQNSGRKLSRGLLNYENVEENTSGGSTGSPSKHLMFLDIKYRNVC
jgi:hypothetical protein